MLEHVYSAVLSPVAVCNVLQHQYVPVSESQPCSPHANLRKTIVLQHLYVAVPAIATARRLESCSTKLKTRISVVLVLATRLVMILSMVIISQLSPRAGYLLRRIAWRRHVGMGLLWVTHLGLIWTAYQTKEKADAEAAAMGSNIDLLQHTSIGKDDTKDGDLECELAEEEFKFHSMEQEVKLFFEGETQGPDTVRKRTLSQDGTAERSSATL